jgi:16S rRNA (guanine527-N7)-methyltransferase
VDSFAGQFWAGLEAGLEHLGLVEFAGHSAKFVEMAEMVLEWNERAGLTTLIDPADMAHKHFLDSLLCLRSAGWPGASDVVDVGSGAGFPGIVLAIVEPARRFLLVESHGRKCEFLRHAATRLGLNVTVAQVRAEEFGRAPDGPGRSRFGVGLARAVAPLALSCEWVLPLVSIGGSYIAQVGPAQGQALERYVAGDRRGHVSGTAWRVLGADLAELKRLALPRDAGERWLVRFHKTARGEAGFPRRPAAARKSPLWVPEG